MLILDAEKYLTNLTIKDFALPGAIILWLILLLWPLTGVDRRDPISGFTYAVYQLACGVVLLLAIGNRLDRWQDWMQSLVVLMAIGLVIGWRWLRHPQGKVSIASAESTQTPQTNES